MPFSNGSATALGVKAHVLYSQLLKADEYWALLGLKSTTEIAAFLKQTAGYKDKFETLVPANVHRIDLENALRSSVLAEAESFLFYLLGVWRDFFLDWLSWYEAEQLKSIFRWIHSKRLDRDEMRRRLYHIPSSKLPYEALLNCRDYREVLEALVNTQYHAVLREPVRRLVNGEKSLFALEFAIDNLVETKLYSDINKLPAHEREILSAAPATDAITSVPNSKGSTAPGSKKPRSSVMDVINHGINVPSIQSTITMPKPPRGIMRSSSLRPVPG